jgi:hypothetical protein
MGDWVVNILGYLWCGGEEFDTVRGVCDLLSRCLHCEGEYSAYWDG